ncbi:hypothetical protein C8R45DRAFT_21736 [Mycena sanguinolenta]|nr:hypothetical protein C8R45DRAFT_21736 [Mycena sanguinolenta]
MLSAYSSVLRRHSFVLWFAFVALLFQDAAAQAYINGQLFTNGLAIIDAPAPQNPGHVGSPSKSSSYFCLPTNADCCIVAIAIDVSGDGKLPASASSNSSDSTHFESLNIYLVSSETNINITVSEGPSLLLNETGSTVKHVNWNIPTCLPAGNYNLTFYETSIFNNQGVFTITPILIPVSNGSPSGQCTGLNTLQAQPQSSIPLTQSPFAPNSTLPTTTSASRAVAVIAGGPALMATLILMMLGIYWT